MTKDFSMKFSSTIGKLKEGDWLRWSCKISMALRVERGWGYVDGTTTAPKDALEFSAWNAAHNQIVGVLGTMVEAPLQCELKSINNMKVAWRKLKEKMHLKWIIAKLKCLMSAICSHIVSDIPTSTTITEIKDTLGSVFKGGAPMNEE